MSSLTTARITDVDSCRTNICVNVNTSWILLILLTFENVCKNKSFRVCLFPSATYTSDRSYIQYPLSEAADTAGACSLATVFTERYFISVDAHTVVKIFIVEFIILAVDRP